MTRNAPGTSIADGQRMRKLFVLLALGGCGLAGSGASHLDTAQLGATSACYSPTQNVDTAYDASAVGCACANEAAVCVGDSSGRQVALFCVGGRWQSGFDGPCMAEGRCYSPTRNLDNAYGQGEQGCACASDPAVCVADSTGRQVALFCVGGHWQAGFDGPCH
jgi:hypothetical protein